MKFAKKNYTHQKQNWNHGNCVLLVLFIHFRWMHLLLHVSARYASFRWQCSFSAVEKMSKETKNGSHASASETHSGWSAMPGSSQTSLSSLIDNKFTADIVLIEGSSFISRFTAILRPFHGRFVYRTNAGRRFTVLLRSFSPPGENIADPEMPGRIIYSRWIECIIFSVGFFILMNSVTQKMLKFC